MVNTNLSLGEGRGQLDYTCVKCPQPPLANGTGLHPFFSHNLVISAGLVERRASKRRFVVADEQ